MGSWKFDQAEAAMASAGVVLDDRDRIATDASELGLTPPVYLQELFERDGGLKAAKAEADLQIEALADIAAATDRLAEKETLLETVGLLGEDPAADLASARDAFEADELHDASRDAERALAERSGAAEAGQTRVLVGGGVVLVLGGGTIVGVRIRARRRRTTSPAPAEPAEPVAEWQAAEGSDATLDPPA
jgi:hypothetical protein